MKTLDQRLPERSILDIYSQCSRAPESTAITMLKTGAEVSSHMRHLCPVTRYDPMLQMYFLLVNTMSPICCSLDETHVTLWAAETAGYAVPIKFLLQPESIAELIKPGAKFWLPLVHTTIGHLGKAGIT